MNREETKKVVTRFAPSPTGFMHIGGVRTAIYAYLWARKNNGTFILRIEDTDKEREVPGSIEHIQESLRWLGIEWDYGPDKPGPFGSCIQSERLPTYIEYAHKLIEKGFAYPDPYTTEELEVFRKKAAEEKRPFLFRDHRPETFEPWDGKKPLRFKVPEVKRYHWHDEARGDLEAGEEALDDFILIKGDGYPTYNFAHIIDDYHMGVTCIIRGEEFISSTPRFLSLYDALGFPYPEFVSAPQILRPDRTKKLGKRDGAKDILEYRTEGYLPETMFNFLTLIGWNPGTEQEIFSKEELVSLFDIHKIQKGGALFNEEKLEWMNKEHIKLLSAQDRTTAILAELRKCGAEIDRLKDTTVTQKLSEVIFERINKWSDVNTLWQAGELGYFFTEPYYDKELLLWKKDPDFARTKERLAKILDLFGSASDQDFSHAEKIKNLIWNFAEQEGRGEVLWPLRTALSGREKSPDPFTIAAILGKTESIHRVEKAIELL